MRKFLPFLLCLSVTVFTVVHTMQPALGCSQDAKTNEEPLSGKQGPANVLFDHETSEDVGSEDDDSAENASNDDGEDVNGNDNGEALGNQDTGVDDGTADDDDSGTDDASEETPR